MGYTTDFDGQFKFDRPLEPLHATYLKAFNEKRRMKRNSAIAEKFPDPVRLAVGLPIGEDGAYFVGGSDDGEIFFGRGQGRDASIIDYNIPPGQIPYTVGGDISKEYAANEKLIEEGKCQPGLWCGWTISEDDAYLIHDGGEKFYHYVEWLQYLINHFFEPWGYKITGTVKWQGEENGDMGKIIVKKNKVTIKMARITYR
jgi:hypothetical protein